MKPSIPLALLLSALALSACRENPSPSPASEPSAAVETTAAAKGNIERTIETYGTVEFSADRQTTVSLVKPGQVIQVPVVAGQLIEKGDVLLSVGAVPRGTPEVQQAAIDAEFAAREMARVRRLVDQKLATNQELQTAALRSASAQSALHSLGGGATIRAKSAGIVASVLVQRGDVVKAGQPGVVIAAKDAMSVRVGVEVEDLPELSTGLHVRLTPIYAKDESKPANALLTTLHRVVDAKTQLVEGIIHVSDPPVWMAAGLAVKVEIVLESHDGVVLVPRQALTHRGGSVGVFIVTDGHARWHPTKLGIENLEHAEVLKGVPAGAQVATTGRTSLEDGMAVRSAADAGRP